MGLRLYLNKCYDRRVIYFTLVLVLIILATLNYLPPFEADNDLWTGKAEVASFFHFADNKSGNSESTQLYGCATRGNYQKGVSGGSVIPPTLATEVSHLPATCQFWNFMKSQHHLVNEVSSVGRYNEALKTVLNLQDVNTNETTTNNMTNKGKERFFFTLLSEGVENVSITNPSLVVWRVRPVVVQLSTSMNSRSCSVYRRYSEGILRTAEVTALNSSLAAELVETLRGEGEGVGTNDVPRSFTTGIGPDWFEGTILLENNKEKRVVPLLFRFVREHCVYEGAAINVGNQPSNITIWVDHVFQKYNAIREVKEQNLPFELQRLSPLPPTSNDSRACVVQGTWSSTEGVARVNGKVLQQQQEEQERLGKLCFRHSVKDRHSDTHRYPWSTWLAIGKDPITNYLIHPTYKDYFAKYYGMTSIHNYSLQPRYKFDLVGRLDLGLVFEWRSSGGDVPVLDPRSQLRGNGHFLIPSFKRWSAPMPDEATEPPVLLKLLQNQRIYFIGDSHVRFAFYALLSRLNVKYPLNKAWRSKRQDNFPGYNMTIIFIPSSLLEINSTDVMKALEDPKGVFIMGVGQHHSVRCESVENHYRYVEDIFTTLLSRLKSPVTGVLGQETVSRDDRLIIWASTMAVAFNRYHQFPRPVGRGRIECRNNLRHLMYTIAEWHAVMRFSQRLAISNNNISTKTNKSFESQIFNNNSTTSYFSVCDKKILCDKFSKNGLRIRFLDLFALSYGMQHSTLDGIHYVTWVREMWIDAILGIIREEFWKPS